MLRVLWQNFLLLPHLAHHLSFILTINDNVSKNDFSHFLELSNNNDFHHQHINNKSMKKQLIK